ncbi:hypothetical protein P22_0734 [Propionispora sp. 2/2-37]|nr:hypothetical protein P22_0734 [Propionispora sp. 2/2-37]
MPLGEILGRFGCAMILSQENCLAVSHRFTHERWGGDFSAKHLCVFLPGLHEAGIFYYDAMLLSVFESLAGRGILFLICDTSFRLRSGDI